MGTSTNKVIIDVREPAEYREGHVANAINIPPDQLLAGSKALADIPKDAEIVLYCRSGRRSAVAQILLSSQGFSNVTNGINQEQVEAGLGLAR